MIRVVLVSCHEYGRAVLAALESYESNSVRLQALITCDRTTGARAVGSRFADLAAVVPAGTPVVCVSDLSLKDLPSTPAASALSADVVLVAGWPRLIATRTVDWLRSICSEVVGFHPARLPHGRGVDPIAWTVWDNAGDAGVSAFLLEPDPDTGPVVAQRAITLGSGCSASVLFALATRGHFEVAREVIECLSQGCLTAIDQDHSQATYWGRMPSSNRVITPNDDWEVADLKARTYSAPYEWARYGDLEGPRIFRAKPGRLVLEDIQVDSNIAYNVGLMGDAILNDRLLPTEPARPVGRRYAGAVIDDGNGQVYLQQRDDKPNIVNPGMVTLFGGVVEGDETYEEGLHRELNEELGLVELDNVRFLGFIDKVEQDASTTRCAIYVVVAPNIASATVMEGKGFAVGTVADLLRMPSVSLVARVALESS